MKHIIHVDNSEFFRKQVKTFLSETGHFSESYSRGEDAMEAVKSGNVNCVIMGLHLSDMSGEELIKQLIAYPKHVVKIVITGSHNEKLLKRLEALGVKTIIQKSSDWKSELGRICT
ncbi:MAG: response regulator [Treponema sp.]|jgi:two-component system cell cycle response regulator|nr:response regulator [Treponema sp.]